MWPTGSVPTWSFEDFIDATALVRQQFPRTRFLLAGSAMFGLEPDYPGRLKRLVAQHGPGESFVFTGFLEDPREFLAAIDLYVLPFRQRDAFPTVVPEAMSMGRAVVATRSGGYEEAVDDNVTGRP